VTKAKKISAPRDRNKLKRPKPPDQEQYERFRQAARELGTDESEEAFERAFRKIVPAKSSR
jgi:hypothetical protein